MDNEIRKCPQCKTLTFLKKGEDKIDQSGDMYYLVTTWTCECGYKRWDAVAPGSKVMYYPLLNPA